MKALNYLIYFLDSFTCCIFLFFKIFDAQGGSKELNITQTGFSQISTQRKEGYRPNKRRKLDVGFDPLCQVLRSEGMYSYSIPWLVS